jgi:hypothetical protein
MIDKFLIEEVFEKFAHFFQKWTGLDNFFLARVAATLSLLVHIAGKVTCGYWTPFTPIIMLAQTFMIFFYIPSVERRVKGDLGPGYKNFLVASSPDTRRFFFWMNTINLLIFSTAPSWQFGYHTLSYTLFTCTLYFAACTPKPPSKGKIKEMLESLTQSWRCEPLTA